MLKLIILSAFLNSIFYFSMFNLDFNNPFSSLNSWSTYGWDYTYFWHFLLVCLGCYSLTCVPVTYHYSQHSPSNTQMATHTLLIKNSTSTGNVFVYILIHHRVNTCYFPNQMLTCVSQNFFKIQEFSNIMSFISL